MAICGKHRGVVVDNQDPQQIGRLRVTAPDVLGDASAFALPAVPYAGRGVGFFALPPIGANVWVEFENSDVNRPIWTGCFWGDGEMPSEARGGIDTKIFKTDRVALTIAESPGNEGITIEVAGMKLVLKNNSIDILNAASSIKLTPASVSINNGALEVI